METLRTAILRFGWDANDEQPQARLGRLDIEVANWAQDITFETPEFRRAITPSPQALAQALEHYVPGFLHEDVTYAILQVANDEMRRKLGFGPHFGE